ncbi:MAG: choice-of-anchor J domain-containing protein, partial [Bacillota bacterium]
MISGKKTLALMICLLLAVSILPRAATAAPGDYFWDFNDMTNGAQPDGFTTAVLDTATYTPSISWLFPGNVGAAVSHLIGDPCAVMGSWFTNTSIQANRWLITPQVVVPENGVLQWKGQSVDPNFLDSYNVLISTGGNDPSEFTTLLSITNEPGGNVYRTYTTHTVDLSGYAGQPVYIAFQLVSLSKFCLFLDDIRIFAAHIITASAGTGGGISPAGETAVGVGGTETYTITPDAGYRIASVLVDGAEQGNVSSYTFSNVQENHTISASFERVFTLTASAGANGTISPDGETAVVVGGTETYTITPSAGYRIASVLVDGAE